MCALRDGSRAVLNGALDASSRSSGLDDLMENGGEVCRRFPDRVVLDRILSAAEAHLRAELGVDHESGKSGVPLVRGRGLEVRLASESDLRDDTDRRHHEGNAARKVLDGFEA